MIGRLGIAVPLAAMAAGMAAWLAWGQPPGARAVPIRGVEWAGKGVWLRAELHTHTRFSDGAHTVDEVVAAAAKNHCDIVAITDHTDGNLKAVTPEYFSAIQAARAANPDLLVVAGIEWNVPPGKGQEHAGVLLPSSLEQQDTLAAFKEQFDDENKEGENPELAIAALAFLKRAGGSGQLPVMLMNHPARVPASTSAPVLTFEGLHRAAPGIVAGVEGGPGHQRSTPLGSYKRPETLIDRWDPLVAQVGGAWDTWLAKGLDVWGAAADADFHHENGEYWPCEFSSTWVYAPDRSIDGVIRALHAGSYFGEHGHIVSKAELSATPAGQTRAAVAGQRLTAAVGSTLSVALALDVPDVDFEGKPNRVDVVELIGVSGGKATVLYSGAPQAPAAFNVPVTVPAGGIVLRARGRRNVDGGPALQFYTNPIRVATAR
ncbi:MAG: PHP domain-containing protein [Acidobacteria bacterium]|nr:PHP domain-containing protein [Acidobacteriota bacterium]